MKRTGPTTNSLPLIHRQKPIRTGLARACKNPVSHVSSRRKSPNPRLIQAYRSQRIAWQISLVYPSVARTILPIPIAYQLR
jgi:hypothetical protein